MLALAGGLAGVALAAWIATRALIALGPRGIPRLEQIGLDGRTLLFALGITLLTGFLFGLAPAFQTSRTDLGGVIREGTRGSKGHAGTRARSTLVVVEMALAVVLLARAGLLIRSFQRLQEVDPGFRPARVTTFNLELPESRYSRSPAKLRQVTAALLERLLALPGVDAVGAAVYGMPFSGGDQRAGRHRRRTGARAPWGGRSESMRVGAASPGPTSRRSASGSCAAAPSARATAPRRRRW